MFTVETERTEVVDDDIIRVTETTYRVYEDGTKEFACETVVERSANSEPEPEPEPTEEELVQAEILLNQAEILAKQNEQDEVLAEILLNQMGV